MISTLQVTTTMLKPHILYNERFRLDNTLGIGIFITIGYLTSKIQYLWYDAPQKTFWERQYEYIYDLFGGNEFYLIFIGAVMVHLFAFWSIVSFFTILDFAEKPEFLYRFKIKHKDYRRMTMSELLHLGKQCIFNQTVLAFPYAFCLYYLLKWRGNPFSPDEIPDFSTVILQMTMHLNLFETFFYYIHRLLHVPIFYNSIHKRHHEITSPNALTSYYFHPMEVLVSVYLPLTTCMLITRCHVNVIYLWIYSAITVGVTEHVGYRFPLYPSPEYHTLHHQTYKKHFGLSGFFDIIHGTDEPQKSHLIIE